MEQAERGVREEIARLVEEGITDGELATPAPTCWAATPSSARPRASGRTCWSRPSTTGCRSTTPLAPDRLAALDRAAVEAAVRRHVRPEEVRVTVGVPGG